MGKISQKLVPGRPFQHSVMFSRGSPIGQTNGLTPYITLDWKGLQRPNTFKLIWPVLKLQRKKVLWIRPWNGYLRSYRAILYFIGSRYEKLGLKTSSWINTTKFACVFKYNTTNFFEWIKFISEDTKIKHANITTIYKDNTTERIYKSN